MGSEMGYVGISCSADWGISCCVGGVCGGGDDVARGVLRRMGCSFRSVCARACAVCAASVVALWVLWSIFWKARSIALGRFGVAARKSMRLATELTTRVACCNAGLFVYVAVRKISPRIPPLPAG